MEVETVYEVLHDKLSRLVELELRSSLLTLGRTDASIVLLSLTRSLHIIHHLAHTVQTGTLGTEHGIFSMLGGFPESGLKLGTLTVGNIEHTL